MRCNMKKPESLTASVLFFIFLFITLTTGILNARQNDIRSPVIVSGLQFFTVEIL